MSTVIFSPNASLSKCDLFQIKYILLISNELGLATNLQFRFSLILNHVLCLVWICFRHYQLKWNGIFMKQIIIIWNYVKSSSVSFTFFNQPHFWQCHGQWTGDNMSEVLCNVDEKQSISGLECWSNYWFTVCMEIMVTLLGFLKKWMGDWIPGVNGSKGSNCSV